VLPDQAATPDPLREMADRLLALGREVEELRAEVRRLKAATPPSMPWRQWVRHRIKVALGLEVHVGRLAFEQDPRPLVVPTRYYRKPALTNPPVISLVTPSFNQGPYLERTLLSVLSQEYPRLQFVVQDGGSTDATADVLAKYRDRFHHCEIRKDNGQAHALNLGFARTSGELMAYLNSDDLLLPGALHAVAKYFEDHPDADAVYGHRVLINQNGDEIGRWVLPPHDAEALKFLDYIPQETLFWRRRVWDKAGGFDERLRFALDWDLVLRFRAAGAQFHRLGRFLGAFRVHDCSKTITIGDSAGAAEAAQLRRRELGRDVTVLEALHALRGYFRRHVFCNRMYTLGLFRY
jgi:glycosyltransferase involved in cell wall biosynthesis